MHCSEWDNFAYEYKAIGNMKEKKAIQNVLKKTTDRDDKFENLVLNLALRKMNGARKDEQGVYFSKGRKRIIMASKTLEGAYAVPSGVEEIDSNAFWGCAYLESVSLPNTLRSIGSEAFGRCLSLHALTIPKSVEKLGINPFVGMEGDGFECESPNYTMEARLLYTADRHTLVACLTDAAMVIIPKTVTTIGDLAFARRRRLKKVVVPEGVKVIGDDAFSDCDALEEITIPATVSEIGNYAFAECDRLRRVNFLGDVKHLHRTAFSDCDLLVTITVPMGLTNAYRKRLHVTEEADVVIAERNANDDGCKKNGEPVNND